MNPEVLRKKRNTLTFNADTGLQNTQVILEFENRTEASPAQNLNVNWVDKSEIPQVLAK